MRAGDGYGLDRMVRWCRRHVLLVDLGWSLLWTFLCYITLVPSWITPAQEPMWAALTGVMGVALVFRRRWPTLTIAVLAIVLVVHVLTMHTFTLTAGVGACAAAHTAHAQLGRRGRVLVSLLIAAGTAWAALDYNRDVVDLPAVQRFPVIIVQWMLVGFFALLGALARKRREELEQAVERAAMLQRQQDQEIRLATLDERTHIAREMHDIVAHSLGVIIAQADGGRYAAACDPTAAGRSLETIAQVGRESLAEMRQLLTVLRRDDARDLAPAPSLDDVGALADDFRKAGLDVRLTVAGEPQEVGGTLALTGYRIVQESLSNALKHAGSPGPIRVKVDLGWSPQALVIDVRNRLSEGDGVDHKGAIPPPARSGGHGLGLAGMRERVAAHGGALSVGPVDGLWHVHAELPLATASAVAAGTPQTTAAGRPSAQEVP